MPRYHRSDPLKVWLDERRVLEVIAQAHRQVAQIMGPGRPQEVGRRLAHAYLLQMAADFQAFGRSLHDLAAEKMVVESGVDARHQPLLLTSSTYGRQLDRGNADLRALETDFRRIGIAQLRQRFSSQISGWGDDQTEMERFIRLRNAVAHGNQQEIQRLRLDGVFDTRTWVAARLPALNRIARALDRIVWDHLSTLFQKDAW